MCFSWNRSRIWKIECNVHLLKNFLDVYVDFKEKLGEIEVDGLKIGNTMEHSKNLRSGLSMVGSIISLDIKSGWEIWK